MGCWENTTTSCIAPPTLSIHLSLCVSVSLCVHLGVVKPTAVPTALLSCRTGHGTVRCFHELFSLYRHFEINEAILSYPHLKQSALEALSPSVPPMEPWSAKGLREGVSEREGKKKYSTRGFGNHNKIIPPPPRLPRGGKSDPGAGCRISSLLHPLHTYTRCETLHSSCSLKVDTEER